MQLDPRFSERLSQFDRATIDDASDSVIGLWPELTIAYCNRGWYEFAERNGALLPIRAHWGIGRCLCDAISGPL